MYEFELELVKQLDGYDDINLLLLAKQTDGTTFQVVSKSSELQDVSAVCMYLFMEMHAC